MSKIDEQLIQSIDSLIEDYRRYGLPEIKQRLIEIYSNLIATLENDNKNKE